MTEAQDLRAFAIALLEDAGAEVRDDGAFLWATIPEAVQPGLDLPAQACLTLDPERIGEFDAELVAPGSYVLEKLLGFATRRGRWDAARLQTDSDAWVAEALDGTAVVPAESSVEIVERADATLVLFAFRTALLSDEKREAFHLVATDLDGDEGWLVGGPVDDTGLDPSPLSGFPPDLAVAYRKAQEILRERLRGELEVFQKASLAALEEEVRRIFRYFDGTVAQVREADPSRADDVVRALEAERDRRLAEALERFEPHATATLCSVRVVVVPAVRARWSTPEGEHVEVRVDALTRAVRGPPGGVTGDARALPRARPPSDTPPRRTTDGRGPARWTRGSMGRSRSAVSRRRGP